jgi:small multidrug resistance pump
LETIMSNALTVLFAACAAALFVAANWIMKEFAHAALPLVIPAAALALAAGALFETALLRAARLGQIVVLIVGLELAFTVLLAIIALGESYSWREVVGLAFVIFGIVLLVGFVGGGGAKTA